MIDVDMQDNQQPLQPVPPQQPLTGPEPPRQPVVTASDPELLQPQPYIKPQDQTPLQGDGGNKQSGWKDFASFVGILLIAGLLAGLLINFVFRSYSVDGPSMETTLQNEDKLIIWKVPRTIARITGNQYIPQRGDVIIFSEDDLGACGQTGERQLIKRVIGLPGERVVVKDGRFSVYNKQNLNGFDPDATLPYNKDGHIPLTTGDVDVTLAGNQIFVSGDNRPDSCDSRAFGPIESDQIIGKLVIRLLPANKIKLF